MELRNTNARYGALRSIVPIVGQQQQQQRQRHRKGQGQRQPQPQSQRPRPPQHHQQQQQCNSVNMKHVLSHGHFRRTYIVGKNMFASQDHLHPCDLRVSSSFKGLITHHSGDGYEF